MAIFQKILFTFCFILLGVLFGHAQVKTLEDTLSSLAPDFYRSIQSNRDKKIRTDSFYIYTQKANNLKFVQSNITQLIADTLPQGALLQLGYDNNTRNVKLPTEAYNIQNASLYTEGFTTIGRTKIMGKFYFDKVWEDSLANNLSGDLENGMPFTHFAMKAGKFERQNIKFEAAAGFRLVKGLYLSSLLNYEHHSTTGSLDPRPDEKIFRLKYKPGLSYKFGKTALGANYTLAKIDGSLNVVYKNRMFNTSELYLDRRLYLNTGYGYITKLSNVAYSDYKSRIDGCGVQLATNIAGWELKANYNYEFDARKNFTLTDDTARVDNPIKEAAHSRYELASQQLNVLLQKEKENNIHQLLVAGLINEGTGQLMSSPSGANYLIDEHNAVFKYLFSIKKNRIARAELGLNSSLNHFFKKDFMSQHFYENTRLILSLSGAKYIPFLKNLLKITAQPSVVVPLKNELSIPETQVNIFSKNIAYAEYDFLGSKYFNGQLGITYYTPHVLRIAGAAWFANINYLHKLENSNIEASKYQPASNRKNQFNLSLGFQIFL